MESHEFSPEPKSSATPQGIPAAFEEGGHAVNSFCWGSLTVPNKYAYHATRISLAFVYFYFGVLKFFDGCSPAESLAGETIHIMFMELFSAESALQALAIFESALGILFLSNKLPKVAFLLFLAHMAGTFTPLILLPEVAFNGSPLMPTLVGQYIWKNVVYVAAVSAVFAPIVFPANSEPEIVHA